MARTSRVKMVEFLAEIGLGYEELADLTDRKLLALYKEVRRAQKEDAKENAAKRRSK